MSEDFSVLFLRELRFSYSAFCISGVTEDTSLGKTWFYSNSAIPELTAVHNLTNRAVLGSWAGPCVHKCCWVAVEWEGLGHPHGTGKACSLLFHKAETLSIDWIGENILNFYKNPELAYKTHLNWLIYCRKVKKPLCDLAQVSGTAVAAPCFCWVPACCTQRVLVADNHFWWVPLF